MRVEVRLFGAPEIRLDGAQVALASTRAMSPLAYLVLQRGRPQRRDHLAFLLWPDSTEKQARTNLRHVLHTLRAAIPDVDQFLHATSRALAWQGSWADVPAFEAALQGTVQGKLQAIDLYTGDRAVAAQPAGYAQLVVVSGEPGVGKTRLVEELRLWS